MLGDTTTASVRIFEQLHNGTADLHLHLLCASKCRLAGTAVTNVTVTVNPALTAPVISVSPNTIDLGQSVNLTTTTPSSGGTPPYTCQWMGEAPDTPYEDLGNSFACSGHTNPFDIFYPPGYGMNSARFWVRDSSQKPVTVTSNIVNVTVNPALMAPVISVSPSTVNVGQSVNFTTTTPFSGGTSPYTEQWTQQAPGGAWVDLGNSSVVRPPLPITTFPGTVLFPLGARGTSHFRLNVTDSSNPPVTVTSNVVSVLVNQVTNTSASSSTSTSSPSATSSSSATLTTTTQSSTTNTFSSSNFPYLIALIVVILIAIIGVAAYYIPRRGRSTGGKKPDVPPPPKPSGQATTSAAPTGVEKVGKPPVGYHLTDKDVLGKPLGSTIAVSDFSSFGYDRLWWDHKHHVWVHQGWKIGPDDPDHMFNDKTGQNANWDEGDHQWIDSSTGQPIGYK